MLLNSHVKNFTVAIVFSQCFEKNGKFSKKTKFYQKATFSRYAKHETLYNLAEVSKHF